MLLEKGVLVMLININLLMNAAERLKNETFGGGRLTEKAGGVFAAEFNTSAVGECKSVLKSSVKNLSSWFKQKENKINAAVRSALAEEKNTETAERSIYTEVRAGPPKDQIIWMGGMRNLVND